MPFYEGIGVIAEKNAIVLDLGTAMTKVGYAGEATPRAIVATPSLIRNLINERSDQSRIRLYDSLVDFIHKLYFEYLLVNPKDRRVVLVDALLGPIKTKEVLSEVLFKHFEAKSILYAPSHLMPLFTLGVQSALVLDIGYSEATLIPVYEGVPILKAWQALPLATKSVLEEVVTLLRETGTVKSVGDEAKKVTEIPEVNEALDTIAEDVMVRLCFVTNLERGQQIQKIRGDASSVSGLSSFLKKSVPSVDYPIREEFILHIQGSVREGASEVLFSRDADCLSISTMILRAIMACPIDIRRDLAKRLVFVGGTSMMLGLKARIFQELEFLVKNVSPFKEELKLTEFKLFDPPTQANCTCWAGASIFGATDAISTRSYTRETFLKEKCAVPDWSNLRFNTLFEPHEDRQG